MKEFVEQGYLQEANRQFFHGLGLALDVKKTGDKYEFSGIWDFRKVEGGIRFNENMIKTQDFINKTNNIKNLQKKNNSLRTQLYGAITQKVPTKVEE